MIQHKPFWAAERRSHNAFGFPQSQVDIAIIGGGLKGLATMYLLSALNRSCILLERGSIGGGESTRNIGAVCTVPDCSPNTFDENVIIERIRMAETNRDKIGMLLDELQYGVDFVRNGGLHLAANATQLAQLEVLHRLLAQNNIVCDELDSDQINALVAGSRFEAGLYYPSEATLNPSKLLDLLVLLNAAFTHNAAVEYFTVDRVEETGTGVDILSDRGTRIHASVVIICTDQFSHFYTNSEIPIGEESASLCFATEPLDKILGKTSMSSRTVTGMQAWTIYDGRIIYSFRNRSSAGDNFAQDNDDIRKAQRFLTHYLPTSKGHHHQEYIWSSTYRKAASLLPFTALAPGSNKIILNVDYGYSVLDLFLAGAEKVAIHTQEVLNNQPVGGAESVEQSSEGDPE